MINKKLKKRLAKTGFDITYTAELAGLLVIVLVAVIVFTRKRRGDR
jgi:LPXTG-motif cell wall-anchored protein